MGEKKNVPNVYWTKIKILPTYSFFFFEELYFILNTPTFLGAENSFVHSLNLYTHRWPWTNPGRATATSGGRVPSPASRVIFSSVLDVLHGRRGALRHASFANAAFSVRGRAPFQKKKKRNKTRKNHVRDYKTLTQRFIITLVSRITRRDRPRKHFHFSP